LQTYQATLKNQLSDFMYKKFGNLTRSNIYDEHFSQLYKEYSFCSSQYHIAMQDLLKEIYRIGIILETITSKNAMKSKNSVQNSIYLNGLIDFQSG
jgi:hypothetical protein